MLFGLLAVIACGAWPSGLAQATVQFSRAQSVFANYANNGVYQPCGVAVDGSGNVYIANAGYNEVLKETLSAGSYIQSVVANGATSGLSYPCALAVDGSGNVYIADSENNQVLKETP